MVSTSTRNKAATKSQSQKNWLLLTDYASKYRVSVSTLRRRIKSGAQEHRFENGKYFLPEPTVRDLDAGVHLATEISATTVSPASSQAATSLGASATQAEPPAGAAASPRAMPAQHFTSSAELGLQESKLSADLNHSTVQVAAAQMAAHETTEGSLLRTTTRLVDELKRAYTQVLQEKEEQILLLKEEIADLKTLVRVLEFDRERQLHQQQQQQTQLR
ncbi:MAG TPA: hypothetical protein PLZ57_01255 [Pseudobdellovibrionaceae bacterium]|nr:hypothetical protein [Pseudobdellovibrionaceae bacterium]